jgi:hypothetical protein
MVLSKGSPDPDKEVPVDGYQYGEAPVTIKDMGIYDYTDVFNNSGWRNIIGTKKGSVDGVRKDYTPSFSLTSN